MGAQTTKEALKPVVVGEQEVGETTRAVSHDVAQTIQVGEHELGLTGRVFIKETGETLRVGEQELGLTSRDFIEETGKTIRRGEDWIGFNAALVVGAPIVAMIVAGWMFTSETGQIYAENIPKITGQVAEAEIKTAEAVAELLEERPEIVEEIGDIVEELVPTAQAGGIAKEIMS